jgi:general secretion pathway protein D
MNKILAPFCLTRRPTRRFAALCLLLPTLLVGQGVPPPPPDDGDIPPPPEFAPRLPANMPVPTRTPGPVPPPLSTRPTTTPVVVPAATTQPSGQPAPAAAPAANQPAIQRPAVTPQIPATAAASPLAPESDPRMRETVGLIRIPDMGTNEVLEMLENFTTKPILRQQSLPAVKITFFSQGPLTRGEAIRAIESLLALNGIAITNLGDKFLKAVPSAVINAQGAPQWEGSTLDAIPSQKIYEKLFRLEFLTGQEAVPMVQPLMSQGAPVSFDKSGFILISDSLVNLQRIERILAVIDVPAALTTKMLFFQLENIGVQDLLRRLQQLQTGALRRQLENTTAFDADDRTNQLIVFTHPGNETLLTELIQRLDVDVAPLTSTKVYNIRYADATTVVSIIEQVVSGQKQVRDQQTSGGGAQAAAAQAAAQRRVAAANQSAAAARADASNLQFSSFLTIVADERANTIVASGTQNDQRFLERLIGEIDTLLAQVRIEVVVAEVRLEDGESRGIDSFGFQYNVASGGGSNPVFGVDTGSNNVDQKYARPGQFWGVTIPGITWGPGGFGIEFVLNAAKTNSKVSVLSAPTIVTTHNKEAVVSVGEERPVIIGVVENVTAGTTSTRDQIQFKDIKLELKVTPLIGSDGVVQLTIEQQIQSVVGVVKINNNDQPVVGTRRANSYVSVRDGEMVVLGGLQSLDASVAKGRMAILGRLPLIGDLFSSDSRNNVRTELLIFIRPTIIRTTDDANRDANERIDQLEDGPRIRRYIEDGSMSRALKPTPPADDARPVQRRNRP